MNIFDIFGWFYWLLTNPYFWLFYLTPSYALVYWGLKSLKPLTPMNDADKERDEKYHAFKRNDLDKIDPFTIYLYAPIIFLKWIGGWSTYVYIYIVVKVLNLTKKDDKPFTGWKL